MDDTQWVRRFSGDGFLWFAETSWHYIEPRCAKELALFVLRFPAAYWAFRKMMMQAKEATT